MMRNTPQTRTHLSNLSPGTSRPAHSRPHRTRFLTLSAFSGVQLRPITLFAITNPVEILQPLSLSRPASTTYQPSLVNKRRNKDVHKHPKLSEKSTQITLFSAL